MRAYKPAADDLEVERNRRTLADAATAPSSLEARVRRSLRVRIDRGRARAFFKSAVGEEQRREHHPMFVLDPEAVAQSEEILTTHLAPVDLSGLDAPLLASPHRVDPLGDDELRLAYTDALVDLRHLLDEIRFEVALACLILWDFRFKIARGEAAECDPVGDLASKHNLPLDVPIPSPVLTFLAVHGIDPPGPAAFFDDPHQHFGNRALGPWFAGQLLDSSLVRSVAALDRLATLLWCRAGVPMPRTKKGTRAPAFIESDLGDHRLTAFYGRDGMGRLATITDHELFIVAKDLRNGFAHSRRGHFQTAGERLSVYETGAERVIVMGGTPEMQINLTVGFFVFAVRPAIAVAIDLVGRADAPACDPQP